MKEGMTSAQLYMMNYARSERSLWLFIIHNSAFTILRRIGAK